MSIKEDANQKQICVQIESNNGTIKYAGLLGDKSQSNYIAGTLELPLLNEDSELKVEGYTSVLLGYCNVANNQRVKKQWIRFMPMERAENSFVFSDGVLQIVKSFDIQGERVIVRLDLCNNSDQSVEIEELALSLPINNDYSRWRYDQSFLYSQKVCEHIYPGAENGYQVVEKLNGNTPVMYLIPLEKTRFEHVLHFPGTINHVRPGIPNHSWPGSSIVYIHSKGYMEGNGYKTLSDKIEATSAVLESKEVQSYTFELGFVENRANLKKLLVERNKIYAIPVPAMSGPIDMTYTLFVYSKTSFAMEDNSQVEVLSVEKSSNCTEYKLKFKNTGENSIRVRNEAGCSMVMVYRITKPIRQLLEKRTDYILNHQVFIEEGHILSGAIVPYTEGKFEGFEGPGLCVKEDSLWGNGSYEGGITDAMFIAEKNVLFPVKEQISGLEKYIDTYVRRYLQNPKTYEVIWWCNGFSITRAYDYMHVANLYYSMYRIARLYGLTKSSTPNEYLELAYKTLIKMYEVSRPMDLIVGIMGGLGIFRILDDLKNEDMIEYYYNLLIKIRNHKHLLFDGEIPYGSECPYDNTGYECISYFADYFKDAKCIEEIIKVIYAIRGGQPVWWWYGSDIRWWDASKDFAENCQHYTSSLNSTALLMLLNNGHFSTDVEGLSTIYGGLLGSIAKIHENGRASMSYCWEQESENFGFHVSTGDVGLGLYGMLVGLQAYAYHSIQDGSIGYMCDLMDGADESVFVVKPMEAAGHKVTWNLENGKGKEVGEISVDTGIINELEIDSISNNIRMEVKYESSFACSSRIAIHTASKPSSVKINGKNGGVEQTGENNYSVNLAVTEDMKMMSIEILFEKI